MDDQHCLAVAGDLEANLAVSGLSNPRYPGSFAVKPVENSLNRDQFPLLTPLGFIPMHIQPVGYLL